MKFEIPTHLQWEVLFNLLQPPGVCFLNNHPKEVRFILQLLGIELMLPQVQQIMDVPRCYCECVRAPGGCSDQQKQRRADGVAVSMTEYPFFIVGFPQSSNTCRTQSDSPLFSRVD